MILATTNANGGLCQEGENEMRKGNVKAINHNILKKYSKRQFCHSLCMVGWMMEHQRSNLQPVHQQQILTHQGKIVCWFSLIPSTVLVYVSLFGLFFFFLLLPSNSCSSVYLSVFLSVITLSILVSHILFYPLFIFSPFSSHLFPHPIFVRFPAVSDSHFTLLSFFSHSPTPLFSSVFPSIPSSFWLVGDSFIQPGINAYQHNDSPRVLSLYPSFFPLIPSLSHFRECL